MTQTKQPHSFIMLGETGKDVKIVNNETAEDISLLLYLYDNLNNLSKTLTQMDSIQKRLFEKLTLLERLVRSI